MRQSPSSQTLTELTQQAIEATKKEFLFYVRTMGIEKARIMMKDTTVFTESINYINNYKG